MKIFGVKFLVKGITLNKVQLAMITIAVAVALLGIGMRAYRDWNIPEHKCQTICVNGHCGKVCIPIKRR